MDIFLQILLFTVGLVALIKGADWLVGGSVSLAKRFQIPDIVIGLTIVAFGTSAPELIVSFFSALSGNSDIAVGNVVGSNIANILLILGAASVIFPLSVHSNTVWKEIPLTFLSALMLAFVALDTFLGSGITTAFVTRGDGLVLLGMFCIFMYYVISSARKGDSVVDEEELVVMGTGKTMLFVFLGLVGLAVGGYLMVESAKTLAAMAGISQQVIGLTIVAIGTSLPELATSVVAALKKKSDIAIGNVLGSNIFNILWILGLTAAISPVPVAPGMTFDILFMVGVTFLLFVALHLGKKHSLDRWQGAAFLLLYVGYTISLFVRT
ncbi:sodium:proton exchanger [Candidatus Gracilibacteria bacterium CG17_big_fil_post_rev_8_21_14_2_50_48_13]|nr:MAG: sodium:proton exchanger [Candidatus Gracilibacteria bacterium CG17_big_fil_post_rev_8_21_14_2_50_48_13]